MPGALTKLPSQLADFAYQFVVTGDKRLSATLAGVHPDRAGHWANSALNNPLVRDAIDEVVTARFAEAVPIALNRLIDMAKNDKGAYKQEMEFAAAKAILDRAGHSVRDTRASKADAPKDLSEMSREELLAALAGTESELANRASVVNPPVDVSNPAQIIDLEE